VSGRSKAYSLFLSMPVGWIRYGQGSQLMKLSNNHNPSTLDNASHELPSASSPNLNRAIPPKTMETISHQELTFACSLSDEWETRKRICMLNGRLNQLFSRGWHHLGLEAMKMPLTVGPPSSRDAV